MKLVIFTPYGETKKAEVLNDLLKGNICLRAKNVLVSGDMVRKHFDSLPADNLEKIVSEWDGVVVEVMLLEDVSAESSGKLEDLAYVSPDEIRALRDIALWYPELF